MNRLCDGRVAVKQKHRSTANHAYKETNSPVEKVNGARSSVGNELQGANFNKSKG
jgi:hypothetical protein